jgi:sec-independent protein translocase protein TatA
MEYSAGIFGGYEVLLILFVVLLIFGGRKIPELARGLGKGIRDFKDATEGDLADDIKNIKKEFDDVKDDVKNIDPTKSIRENNPLKNKKKKS